MTMAASIIPLGASLAYATTFERLTKMKFQQTRQSLVGLCLNSEPRHKRFIAQNYHGNDGIINRRDAIRFIGLTSGICFDLSLMHDARGTGFPPEEKAKLCDAICEKELENVPMVTTESGLQYKDIKNGVGPSPPVGFQVAANYVAMVPSGQVFDRVISATRILLCEGDEGSIEFSSLQQ